SEFDRLSEVMRFEPAMVHKLFRYVNSASHGLRREIESIQHALSLLGEREVRKWVSLVVVAGWAASKPRQLVVNSVVRGRFCEQLCDQIGMGARKPEMFLLGMYSLIDAVLDRPMKEIVDQVPLANDIRSALLGVRSTPPRIADLLAAAVAVEVPVWDDMEAIARRTGPAIGVFQTTYVEAVSWAEEIFQA
ncbi:MAG: HDOD domain-containing protein, partial [bacterium]|nr:HDOD domain-containing protein [bacterium]